MKKACIIILIILAILIVLGVLGWYLFKPAAIRWFCRKGTEDMLERSVKMSPDAYYKACLKKYGLTDVEDEEY